MNEPTETPRADEQLEDRVKQLEGALQTALEYFSDREDADHDGHKFVGNEEMKIAQEIREALAGSTAKGDGSEKAASTAGEVEGESCDHQYRERTGGVSCLNCGQFIDNSGEIHQPL